MKWKFFAAILVAAMAAGTGVLLFAQDDSDGFVPKPPASDPVFFDDARVKPASNKEFVEEADPPNNKFKRTPSEKEELRGLAVQYADTAEPEELRQMIQDLRKKLADAEARRAAAIAESEARRMVKEAEQLLNDALAKYPSTGAATQAKAMLNAIEQKK
jgi:hypothetical protein